MKKPIPVLDIAAKALGVFSLALGLAELLAPKRVAKPFGMHHHKNVMRGYGAREIVSGLGLLAAKNKAPWMWGRVAGNTMDLATLGAGAWSNTRQRKNIAAAAALMLGLTIVDILVARRSGPFQPMQLIRNHYRPRALGKPVHFIKEAANDFLHRKSSSAKKKA